jgi:cytochrome c oxidase subunit 4
MAHEARPFVDEHEDNPESHVPLSAYLGVFTALMVGTAVTVWAAYQDFGMWNTPVAMAIAIVKASLVILIFMHVKYGSKLVMVMAAGAFFWLFHMIVGTLADYMSRGYLGTPGS